MQEDEVKIPSSSHTQNQNEWSFQSGNTQSFQLRKIMSKSDTYQDQLKYHDVQFEQQEPNFFWEENSSDHNLLQHSFINNLDCINEDNLNAISKLQSQQKHLNRLYQQNPSCLQKSVKENYEEDKKTRQLPNFERNFFVIFKKHFQKILPQRIYKAKMNHKDKRGRYAYAQIINKEEKSALLILTYIIIKQLKFNQRFEEISDFYQDAFKFFEQQLRKINQRTGGAQTKDQIKKLKNTSDAFKLFQKHPQISLMLLFDQGVKLTPKLALGLKVKNALKKLKNYREKIDQEYLQEQSYSNLSPSIGLIEDQQIRFESLYNVDKIKMLLDRQQEIKNLLNSQNEAKRQ